MQKSRLNEPEPEDAPEDTIPGASGSFKKLQLRLLMTEREEVVSRLVELDYKIWALEEHFRAGNPWATEPTGTPVPGGSLSSQGKKVKP